MVKSKKLTYFSLVDFHKKHKNRYHIMLILSFKGVGKTTSAVKLCINNWEKNHKSFAYIFRYQVEIDGFINELKGLLSSKYYWKKEKVSTAIYEKESGELIGILSSLSQAHYLKNIHTLNLIIFDEFVSATKRYLKNEMKQFFLLVSNLIRTKKKWNVYMLGNYHGPDMPYFNYLKMYQWKHDEHGILNDGNIGYFQIKNDVYKNVGEAQSANFLTEYDDELNQKYVKGGFTIQDLNMVQQKDVAIVKTYYAVVYDNMKSYVHLTIDNKLYFSKHGFTERVYVLSLLDGLNYNNNKLDGKPLSELWLAKVLNKQVIFENFDIKNNIFRYLEIVNYSYEFK